MLNWIFKFALPSAVLLILEVSVCRGQMINNKDGKAFESPITFNRSFIWENKILLIEENVLVKMPGRPIDDLQQDIHYYFGNTGILEKKETIAPRNYIPDTTSILYQRNDIGQLFAIESKNVQETTIVQNAYDSNGKIIRQDTKQIIPSGNHENREILVESNSYEYQFPHPNIVVRNNINNYGLTYSAFSTERNDQGFLIKEKEEYFISHRIIEANYQYNERGWVSTVTRTDSQNKEIEKTSYEYDAKGNVLFAKKFINNQPVEEYEVLYQNASLVKAILHQDLSSQVITIHKYEYRFR
jgi:hypothetical protein